MGKIERLTKRDPRYKKDDKNFLSPYCIVDSGLDADAKRLTKLGELEDIMEKYNIQNPVQLDVIIGSCMKFADAFTKKLKSGR